MSGNYYRKLSVELSLVYYVAEKCGNYRDTITGVSENELNKMLILQLFSRQKRFIKTLKN